MFHTLLKLKCFYFSNCWGFFFPHCSWETDPNPIESNNRIHVTDSRLWIGNKFSYCA